MPSVFCSTVLIARHTSGKQGVALYVRVGIDPSVHGNPRPVESLPDLYSPLMAHNPGLFVTVLVHRQKQGSTYLRDPWTQATGNV